MPSIKYQYVIADDTANGAVNNNDLFAEILASPAVEIAPERVDSAGANIEVWMKAMMPDHVGTSENGTSALIAAVVGAHQGNPPASEVQVFAPTFENTGGLHPEWKGHLYTAVAGATNIFDELVTTEKQLRAGWYELMDNNAQVGDYIEEAIVDKDDVLGLFSLYGLTPGLHVLELKKYVAQKHINPLTAGQRIAFDVGSTFVMTAGLYMRTIYQSTGPTDVQLEVVTLAYE